LLCLPGALAAFRDHSGQPAAGETRCHGTRDDCSADDSRVHGIHRPVAGGYSNLEYDLKQGKRGSRYVHVENILKELTSAEAAMVVNNNAAAVLVALETLAKNQEVIVSRGQLVEIGGSFRIPDVMRKSGAVMVEVGTTNKTHLQDFEEATGPETGLLLQVHTSNFQIVGFTEQ
ncbi:MAG: hypothetical protein GY852_00925, partial [bacterium]|nr:hypothetical protein [bacterium]